MFGRNYCWTFSSKLCIDTLCRLIFDITYNYCTRFRNLTVRLCVNCNQHSKYRLSKPHFSQNAGFFVTLGFRNFDKNFWPSTEGDLFCLTFSKKNRKSLNLEKLKLETILIYKFIFAILIDIAHALSCSIVVYIHLKTTDAIIPFTYLIRTITSSPKH